MHEDYEDDDYDDSQDNLESQYKHYFKFDPDAWDAWGKLLTDALKDIVEYPNNTWYVMPNISGFPKKSVPVNDYFSNTGGFKNSLYLGNNHYKEPIFKTKYFIHNKLDTHYRNHLIANAVHFLQQPNYYGGMFDILN